VELTDIADTYFLLSTPLIWSDRGDGKLSQMLATMKRTSSALLTGRIDLDRAPRMFLSDCMRPKSRTTRRARTTRITFAGMVTGPRAIRDRLTTTTSSWFHPSEAKGRNQCENMFMSSSTVKTAVKKKSTRLRMTASLELSASSRLVAELLRWDAVILAKKFCR
jgi:hypothetical protein